MKYLSGSACFPTYTDKNMKNLSLFTLLLSLIHLNECHAFQTGMVTRESIDFPGINTTRQDETIPLLTQDGKRLYFTRTNPWKAGEVTNSPLHEIWYADKNPNGTWTPVKAPKPLNAGLNSAVVGLNQEANTIYLFGTYSKFNEDQKGLSYSRFENNKWTKPKRINIPGLNIEGHFYGIHVHISEKIILISKGDQRNEDLYVSIQDKNKKWSVPRSLGPHINTPAFEFSPYLTKDMKYLFFSRGDEDMDTNIYYSKRLDDSWTQWTVPQRLEGPVNSTGFDAYFSIHSDSTIVFSSNRAGTSDIYLDKLNLDAYQEANILAGAVAPPVEPEQADKAKLPFESIAIDDISPLEGDLEYKGIIEGNNLINGYLFFGFNSFQLSIRQRTVLDQVIQRLQDQPDLRISISGHIDAMENKPTYEKLSEKRAMEVRNYLVSNGILQQRILLTVHDELLPIANNNHSNGRKLNRRVEITWY